MTTDYRVNRQIRIPEVRLIDQNGAQIGVIATAEAMKMAEVAKLDLVEVSPMAKPPVCRILDFGKFKYAQAKKERGHHSRASQLKELRVRPAIDKHDLEYRLDAGRKFLEQGHKVQVVCIFRGRQMAHRARLRGDEEGRREPRRHLQDREPRAPAGQAHDDALVPQVGG